MGARYPPPIPSISMSGKPWVCFKSYRHDGRFVLKEIRIPTKELLQASREDGRLRLHFIQPKDRSWRGRKRRRRKPKSKERP
ncbi:hypothetical protein SAY86_002285 [Trapa natans]|uniref:FAF domain-containing protein n=1 Tax=Trapa natans TaxID=22666 RepID=A0AAN7R369_TRANT|nr:hypothetical protein SAY86_002285 [Trapa natans]